jgi:hypothetical protein
LQEKVEDLVQVETVYEEKPREECSYLDYYPDLDITEPLKILREPPDKGWEIVTAKPKDKTTQVKSKTAKNKSSKSNNKASSRKLPGTPSLTHVGADLKKGARTDKALVDELPSDNSIVPEAEETEFRRHSKTRTIKVEPAVSIKEVTPTNESSASRSLVPMNGELLSEKCSEDSRRQQDFMDIDRADDASEERGVEIKNEQADVPANLSNVEKSDLLKQKILARLPKASFRRIPKRETEDSFMPRTPFVRPEHYIRHIGTRVRSFAVFFLVSPSILSFRPIFGFGDLELTLF